MTTRRLLWVLLGVASVVWAGSWRIIYLEVTRWHHMDARLRFTTPSPGLPVIMLRVVAGVAPLAVLGAAVLLVRRSRTRRHLSRPVTGAMMRVDRGGR